MAFSLVPSQRHEDGPDGELPLALLLGQRPEIAAGEADLVPLLQGSPRRRSRHRPAPWFHRIAPGIRRNSKHGRTSSAAFRNSAQVGGDASANSCRECNRGYPGRPRSPSAVACRGSGRLVPPTPSSPSLACPLDRTMGLRIGLALVAPVFLESRFNSRRSDFEFCLWRSKWD